MVEYIPPLRSFTLRDWELFLGPYLGWSLACFPLWRFGHKRIRKPAIRAAVFGVLFAPAAIPILREAFVIGPALWGLAYFAIMMAMGPSAHSSGWTDILPSLLISMISCSCIYAVVNRRC
jgi:hypothetical protein